MTIDRKHILVTSAWFPSAKNSNGVFVKEQAEALARAGHRVTILIITQSLLRPWLRGLFDTDKIKFDEGKGITVVRKHLVFPFPARFYGNAGAVVKAHFGSTMLKWARRYVARYGPVDLVHHHCMSDNSYIAEAIASGLGVPYVLTEYSNYWSYAELDKFNWFESFEDHKRFVQNAAVRIAATDIRCRGYEEIFGAPFTCVPNLVIDLFRASPTARPERPFTFICVAILDARKRQDLLLKAFQTTFRSEDVRLILVGNGRMEAEYRRIAKELGIDDQVSFAGKRGRQEVRKLFDQSHVGVISSEQETFAIALAEAMFRGLPVISTSCGGPEEFVTDRNGLLVEVGNQEQLAAKMKFMRDNYSRYDGEEIRDWAISRYCEDVIVNQIDRQYDLALSMVGSDCSVERDIVL